jgi:hypothetical protein
MKRLLKRMLNRFRNYINWGIEKNIDKLLMINGRNAANSVRIINEINALSDIGFKVYSQFDEDGILEWLIQRIPISSCKFVEFGVENYLESNTRFLIKNRNWKGLVMDSSQDYIDFIRKDDIYWRHNLIAHCDFVTPQNINELLINYNFNNQIGILSIDAGGMDYWIWKAIDVIIPDIVICEYNAVFGDIYPIVIPYQKDFISINIHNSGLYWGASTKAFEQLGLIKNYRLIGSNIGGNNLFFIKNELYGYVDKLIKSTRSNPSQYRDSRSYDGKLTYITGIKRFEVIKHLPVINLNTNEEVLLESLDSIYSKEWIGLMS